jgi:hypothetical protein
MKVDGLSLVFCTVIVYILRRCLVVFHGGMRNDGSFKRRNGAGVAGERGAAAEK